MNTTASPLPVGLLPVKQEPVSPDPRKGVLPPNVIVEGKDVQNELDGPSLVGMVTHMNLEPEVKELVVGLIKHLLAGGVYKTYLDEHNLNWDKLAALCFGKPILWKAIDSAHYAARVQRLRRLESEAMRRAVDGVEQEFYDKEGNVVRTKTEYSDDLMKVLLKAHDPDTYADRQKVDHTGVMVNLNIEGIKRDPTA